MRCLLAPGWDRHDALGARAEIAAVPAGERFRERLASARGRAARGRDRAPQAPLRAARHRPGDHRRATHRRDPRASPTSGTRGLVTTIKDKVEASVADKI